MRIHPFALLLFLLPLLSCGSDQDPATTDRNETKTTGQMAAEEWEQLPMEEKLAKLAPPPPNCSFLTEADIFSTFGEGITIPLPASPSPGVYNSCMYYVDGQGWTSTLALEFPDLDEDGEAMRQTVAGATGAEKIDVGGTAARIENEGRLITVAADRPFRLKFTPMPTGDTSQPYSAEERRTLMAELARAVMTM